MITKKNPTQHAPNLNAPDLDIYAPFSFFLILPIQPRTSIFYTLSHTQPLVMPEHGSPRFSDNRLHELVANVAISLVSTVHKSQNSMRATSKQLSTKDNSD
jgi:hypothetical protein